MASDKSLDDLKRLTVLYVDDDAGIRAELARYLDKRVGGLVTAADGAAGLERFAADRPDLVLADIRMPVMDGHRMAEEIKRRSPETPVILITAHGEFEDLKHAIDIGVDGFILKPINFDQMTATIRRAVEQLMRSREIAATRAQLAIYHQANEEERHLVAKLMSYMMRPENLRDGQVRYWLRPADVVGGDLVAVARSPNDRLYVMLADSTGHGLPAALNLLPINHIFYRMVSKKLPVSLIVEEMNWAVREQSPIERYVCAFVACFDMRNRVVEAWNGGLPTALFFDDRGRIVRGFQSKNFPLGVLDRTFVAQTDMFQWPHHGQLMIYSDGLEDVENESGMPFGEDAILRTLKTSPAESRFDALAAAVEAHKGSRNALDDITFMMIATEPPAVDETTPIAAGMQGVSRQPDSIQAVTE